MSIFDYFSWIYDGAIIEAMMAPLSGPCTHRFLTTSEKTAKNKESVLNCFESVIIK